MVGHRERMETTFFLAALALAPAGVALARRQCGRVGPRRVTSLALLDVAGLSAAILAARAAAATQGTDIVPWVLLVGVRPSSQASTSSPTDAPHLLPTAAGIARPIAFVGACAFLGAAVLSFYPRSLFAPERLWLCALVAMLVAAARGLRLSVSISRFWRRAIDAGVVTTIVLVVTDVNDYSGTLRYDYDFFLGPVNAMSHGHPLLVDTFSQYGVGMFYALAAAFHAVPLSYGGLQVVLCLAYAAEFALVYTVLRLACRSQLVAVLGLAVALVANLMRAPAAVHRVSQHGAASLRLALGGDPGRDAAGAIDRASAAPRRDDGPDGGRRRRVERRDLRLCPRGVRGDHGVRRYATRGSRSERSLAVAKRIAAAVVAGFVAVGATSAVSLLVAGDWPRWTEYLSLVGALRACAASARC